MPPGPPLPPPSHPRPAAAAPLTRPPPPPAPPAPRAAALEPHSALPTAIPAAFGTRSVLLPASLRGRTHGLVSSVCFKFPLVRHLYWW
jgi:hypothetical protein